MTCGEIVACIFFLACGELAWDYIFYGSPRPAALVGSVNFVVHALLIYKLHVVVLLSCKSTACYECTSCAIIGQYSRSLALS